MGIQFNAFNVDLFTGGGVMGRMGGWGGCGQVILSCGVERARVCWRGGHRRLIGIGANIRITKIIYIRDTCRDNIRAKN